MIKNIKLIVLLWIISLLMCCCQSITPEKAVSMKTPLNVSAFISQYYNENETYAYFCDITDTLYHGNLDSYNTYWNLKMLLSLDGEIDKTLIENLREIYSKRTIETLDFSSLNDLLIEIDLQKILFNKVIDTAYFEKQLHKFVNVDLLFEDDYLTTWNSTLIALNILEAMEQWPKDIVNAIENRAITVIMEKNWDAKDINLESELFGDSTAALLCLCKIKYEFEFFDPNIKQSIFKWYSACIESFDKIDYFDTSETISYVNYLEILDSISLYIGKSMNLSDNLSQACTNILLNYNLEIEQPQLSYQIIYLLQKFQIQINIKYKIRENILSGYCYGWNTFYFDIVDNFYGMKIADTEQFPYNKDKLYAQVISYMRTLSLDENQLNTKKWYFFVLTCKHLDKEELLPKQEIINIINKQLTSEISDAIELYYIYEIYSILKSDISLIREEYGRIYSDIQIETLTSEELYYYILLSTSLDIKINIKSTIEQINYLLVKKGDYASFAYSENFPILNNYSNYFMVKSLHMLDKNIDLETINALKKFISKTQSDFGGYQIEPPVAGADESDFLLEAHYFTLLTVQILDQMEADIS